MSEAVTVPDHDRLYNLLADEILRFRWVPGERLSENDLCRRFSLSRTPVRSLLQRLQENGLVQIVPKKGSLVTRLSMDTINQLIYERVAVESMVMRDYIAVRNQTDIEKIRYLYAQMEKEASLFGTEDFDAGNFMRRDLAMHHEWFHRMNLNILWRRLSKPESSYTRFCMLDLLEGNNLPDVMEEHQQMIRIIESGETGQIEELLKKHLFGGIRRLGPNIYTKYADYFEPFEEGSDDV